ncbi:hypothetical protein [Cryobacterium tagatosivorans]|uniref:hypothetical protein n=1 Tax=Cryobacterium tagatosivorans TaxID=1259199 RepID=UPI0015812EC9|nr:hypothetical protein [Cryobacterium tagatosivorans]
MTLSLITPSMAAYRVLLLRKPVDQAFLVSLNDGVLLTAVGLGRPKSRPWFEFGGLSLPQFRVPSKPDRPGLRMML